MNIHYFTRKFNFHQNSIEKLFDVIIHEVSAKKNDTKIFENPYSLSFIGLIKTLLFFRKNQGQINHITGDIHWSCMLLNRKKTVLTIHDLVGLQNIKSSLKKKIYYFFWVYLPVMKLKYITTISEKTKQEIVQLIPSAKSKIKVIPNCLTVETAPLVLDKKNVIPKIILVGTRENKNIENTLRALINLEVELIIIGELSKSQKEILKSNNFNYKNYIRITDEELLSKYDEADILCFASLYEGFGLPILEAQARNCAVITSDISPMKEVAEQSAILVNPYNVEEIRNAVILITSSDKEEKEKLINLGKENIAKYSANEIADLYISYYKEMMKHK